MHKEPPRRADSPTCGCSCRRPVAQRQEQLTALDRRTPSLDCRSRKRILSRCPWREIEAPVLRKIGAAILRKTHRGSQSWLNCSAALPEMLVIVSSVDSCRGSYQGGG